MVLRRGLPPPEPFRAVLHLPQHPPEAVRAERAGGDREKAVDPCQDQEETLHGATITRLRWVTSDAMETAMHRPRSAPQDAPRESLRPRLPASVWRNLPARRPFAARAGTTATLALAGVIAACGSARPDDPHAHPRPPQDDGMAELHALNARARRGGVEESVHGVTIADPYRSLEEDTPDTRAWIDAQTTRSAKALDDTLSSDARARIRTLFQIGSLGGAQVGGTRTFYQKREGGRERAALFLAEAGTPDAEPLVDPGRFGERAALDWYAASPSGRYVTFGISHDGDERSTLHVLDVDTRRLLNERIARTKWSSIAWLHDESGFYYRRYPKPGEDGFDGDHEDAYFPRIFFHPLGADPSEDPRFWGAPASTDFPGVSVSRDDRYLVVTNFRGWSASDLFLVDRGVAEESRPHVPDGSHPLVPVVVGEDAITTGFVHEDRLYMLTNLDAPRYRVVVVPVTEADDRDAWEDLVPESDAALEGWAMVGDQLALHYLDDVRSVVRMVDLDGGPVDEIPLPGRGSVDGLTGQPGDPKLVLTFESPLQPPVLLSIDTTSDARTTIDAAEADIDLSAYVMEQVAVSSADGTEIPLQITRRRDAPRDGQQPVILYGYGGFNVALTPTFRRSALFWLERGGIYAVANLRGGGEFGEDWHRAGNLDNKERVFEDFEACIRWLDESGWSRPDKIAITGGSNGGLLMGAMITRVPDRFAAAATYVGLYDMVRYHEFPPAELWVSEYGSAEDPAQLSWLLKYSPYHRVRHGVAYPAVLVETADHDSRVYWGHSTKFAARLQEATGGDAPIYFYMQRQIGHGAGTGISDQVDRHARMIAFFEAALGMAPAAPSGDGRDDAARVR